MNRFLETACAHGPVDKAPPDQRLWPLLRRIMTDGRRGERAIHLPDSYNFPTPAQGDGYGFELIINFTWCVTGRRRVERLMERADQCHGTLRERLLVELRPISRRYPPYDAAPAEEDIARKVNELFSEVKYDYQSPEGPDGQVRPIEPRTAVHLDKAVQEIQRKSWDMRQQAANAHAYATLLVPQMAKLRELWREFLKSGENQWVTPYAVALANNPEQAPEIVGQMFKDRRGQARELAKEVVEQSKQYGGQNAFELMTSNDTVLRRLMTLMGVEEPAELAPGPFEEIDGWRASGVNGDGSA